MNMEDEVEKSYKQNSLSNKKDLESKLDFCSKEL